MVDGEWGMVDERRKKMSTEHPTSNIEVGK